LPLSRRARIEVYLPERRKPNYRRLKKAIEKEFLETFGGCTVIRSIKGLYLSSEGKADFDKIDLVYADTPFDFDKNLSAVSKYADELRSAVLDVTEEESLLIVVHAIYHAV